MRNTYKTKPANTRVRGPFLRRLQGVFDARRCDVKAARPPIVKLAALVVLNLTRGACRTAVHFMEALERRAPELTLS